ncbi:hypothetical protein TcasGA2_TC007134 [Tribolium castaneum]|uniref:Homeobox domain-containing protein n=1 Tax=Tribolium castaneum TaxID=7070 RepID=D2A181_TRICA|nr:hypothetical protein TcasGA2_TC007134 [Tribolium castaneum]
MGVTSNPARWGGVMGKLIRRHCDKQMERRRTTEVERDMPPERFARIVTVWFQNRRAKFRKQERLAQQKASNNSENSTPPTSIKAESNGNTKSSLNGSKDIKPGSPHSSISTTPNSNTSSISSHQSSNGVDVKPVNGNGKLSEDAIISNNNKWSMSPQSCNTALLVHQANKVLSSQPSHLQTHHGSHAAAAAAAALSSPFSSLLGASGGAASYLLGDHLKPAAAANHLF